MAPRRADREPWNMTISRMMTRSRRLGLHVNALPEAFAVATARAAIARGLLGPAEDPLREAKEVLGRPGPLSSDLRA
jgi:hypothetical protein